MRNDGWGWCEQHVPRYTQALDCGADTAKGQVQVGEQHLPEEEKEQDSQRDVQTLGGASMIEVLKQALEALEDFVDVIKYDNEQDDIGRRACCDVLSYNPHSESCKAKQAITAIKEAIREHAMYEVQRLGQEIEQEPVAWIWKDMRGQEIVSLFEPRLNSVPLYTHQPQRTEQEPVAYCEIHHLPEPCVQCAKEHEGYNTEKNNA